MKKYYPVRYVFIIGLFIAFFLDGSISLIFSHLLFGNFMFIPNLTFIWLFLGMYFINRTNEHIEMWAAIIGLVFDLYYTGIIGVNVIIFPLAIYIGKKLYQYLPTNVLMGIVSFGINIVLINMLSFWLNRLMHVTNYSGSYFIVHAMIPTLIFNLIIFMILFIPVGVLFDRIE